jgi:hypothetical protein
MQILHMPSDQLPLLFVRRSGPLCAASTIADSPFIDFISAYCDHWCERCAFTSRCPAFAWQAARERSRADRGDPLKALQLRVSTDRTESTAPAADVAECSRRERARDGRVEASKIMQLAVEYGECSTAWVDDRRGRVAAQADSAVVEAFETICWDAFFIRVPLRRALRGLDRAQSGEEHFCDDPIQNDWNGSAKLALISIERSVFSWRLLGPPEMQDDASRNCRGLLDLLGRAVTDAFPDAMLFRRPGFDG